MKLSRWIAALAAIALCCVPARAQNPTAVSGTINDPNGVAYYPATVTACLTPVTTDPIVNGVHVNPRQGTNYCAPLANTTPTGAFSLSLFPNASITCVPSCGATQWSFTVTAAGAAPPSGKGPQTFQVNITISGTSQDVGATLTASSLALLNSSGGGITQYSKNIIDAANAPYNVTPGFFVFDATFTNTSTTVVTSSGDPACTASMAGWAIFGTSTSGGGVNHINAVQVMAEGTIQSCAAHSIVSSTAGNASSAGTATQTLIWGPIEDTQLTSAEQAAWGSNGPCYSLQLPGGPVLLHLSHFPGNGFTIKCQSGMSGNGEPGALIKGWGYKVSLLVPTPLFDFTSAIAQPGSAGQKVIFGGQTGFSYEEFGIWGGENGNGTNPASAVDVIMLPTDGQLWNVMLSGWLAGTGSNLTGIVVLTNGQYPLTVICDGMGETCGSIQGLYTPLFGSFFGDNNGTNLSIGTGAQVRDYGSAYGVTASGGSSITVASGAVYYGSGISIIGTTGAVGIRNNGGTVYLDDLQFPAGNAPNQGLWNAAASAKTYARNSLFWGATNPILSLATTLFVDEGGNTPVGGSNSFGAGAYVGTPEAYTAIPTISSGFGTSPSIANNSGEFTFTVNVGTGGTATSGVISLPAGSLTAALHGWDVKCVDITTNSATVFMTKQTATTTTTATIGNFNTSGVAAAWVASDILSCNASPY